MNTVFTILSVARYERKMLMRTIRFRILGGIGVLIPVVLGIGLAIAESRGVEFESVSGIGAYMPFFVYSLLQTVVIAFIVGDFRAADERAGIYEVIGARPLSTAELVMGKYLGVLGALITLSLIVLVLSLGVQAAKISITGAPFTIRPYLTYLLLLNLPGLIYMSALTFFLGAVLRRQAAVTVLTIAYVLIVLLFLGRRYGGVYDFGAFFAPVFYSDMLGLGDIRRVVEIRFFYTLLALFFFGLSIDRYPRLPQSRAWRRFGRCLTAGGFVAALGFYLNIENRDASDLAYRTAQLEIHERYAGQPTVAVTHYTLDLDLAADRSPLRGTAVLRVSNPHSVPLDTLVFSLNPGLRLRSVIVRNGEDAAVNWRREYAVVRVARTLQPDSMATLAFVYDGSIDLSGFDLKRHPDARRLQKRRAGPGRKGDLTAWIRANSVFLPPRSRWYPSPGVDYGHEDGRPVSFATADLDISLPAGLEVVTQGMPVSRKTEGDREVHSWKARRPVPFLSLNAGVYRVFQADIHNIQCAVYVHPAHARQVTFFEDARDDALETLGEILDSVEQETGLAYPYERLSVVEVPFQVQWYYDGWEEAGGLVQPGVLMLEEDVLMRLNLQRRLKWMQRRQRRNDDPARIKRDLLVSAVLRTFLARESSQSGIYRSPVAHLWSFNKGFEGEHYSLLKRGMPVYIQQHLESSLQQSLYSRRGRFRGLFRRNRGARGVSWDTVTSKMRQRSFAELDPDADAELYRAVVDAKGASMFGMMQAVVGDETFRDVVSGFEESNRHAAVDFESFERAAVGDSSSRAERPNLHRLVSDWLHGTQVPGYTLTRAKAYKVDDGWGMMVYQVVVRVRNGEPGRGFVQIRAMGSEDEAVKGVEIEGGQEVEVGLILWERPSRISVEPFFARNRRVLMAPLRIPEQPMDGSATTYVREVAPDETGLTEIIVDNDDEGFEMPVRRVRRYLRPQLKGDNWQERQMPFSFGRYETNYRWKKPGDGAQPAVWTARLPHSGDYDVYYYFVHPRFARRLRMATEFSLAVCHGGEVHTLAVEADKLKGGWNVMGRYRFEGGELARVELSDRANGRLYADAVRWRFVDPDHPEEVYEEDLPTWNFGRGRRGGDRGGRGGGSRSGGGQTRGRGW